MHKQRTTEVGIRISSNTSFEIEIRRRQRLMSAKAMLDVRRFSTAYNRPF